MKKLFYFLLALPFFALAQSTDQNYTKTTYYKQANTTSVSNPAPSVAMVQVTYYDGFGRPIQQIANQLSGTGNDIVIPMEYDALGRQAKEFLPYSLAGSTMAYEPSATTDILNYSLYTGQTPYSEKQFESSPLSRVLKQGQSGTDWDLPVTASDPDHTVKADYQTNTATEVKLYVATATWSATNGLYNIAFSQNGNTNYPANELSKTVIKNENWTAGNNNTMQEFKDKDGNVVLKRTFDNGVAHDTYYVYDQFGNLTYIIPPLVTNIATQLDGLCYQYKYDYRNRLVEKKLPGKQWQFTVYDKLNRVVATGPNFSPFNNIVAPNNVGWMIAKYDAFNRTIYTGWAQSTTVTSAGRKILQDAQNNLTTTLNETKLTSGTIDGIPAYYSNLVAPTSFKLLMVNYYDNYTFPDVPVIPTTVESQATLTTAQVKGLSTGNWTRVLTKSTNIDGETNAVFYDAKGRSIRAYQKNYLGGYTQVDSKLDFAGVPQYMITYHKRLTSDTELKTTDTFVYTPQGRLATHTHQIGTIGAIELLSKNDYNEIGQLITKRVGDTDITGAASLQKIDYTYNIRGWLTGINNVADLGTTQPDLFAFKINYNTVQNETGYTGTALYNGNVSETYWKSKSDNVLRKYGYKYDNLHRLKNAIYQKPGATVVVQNSYNERLTYDKNGNITNLRRNGNGDGISPAIEIDNLDYTYDTNSNKLLKVADTPTTNTSGFKDGANTDDDYKYDANGNMILDQNKGITDIVYNHMNLPTKITFGTAGTIEYVYNALGQKVNKIVRVTTPESITSTDYLTGYQYKNLVLQFFPTSEGYVAKNGTLYNYVYQYKDHLGNARVSYTKNTTSGVLEIIEESHFYPFGLKHSGYNTTILSSGNADAQKYKFQEQERQEELGLNLDNFKYRNYDYAIGRFLSVDPLSEKYHYWSPYTFSGNQVVHSRELEGLEPDNDLNQSPGFEGNEIQQSELQSGDPYGGTFNDVLVERTVHVNRENDEEKEGTDDSEDFDNDGFDGYDYADGIGQIANATTVVWGTTQLGVDRLRQVNLASSVGEAFGIGTQVAAPRLQAFTNTLGAWGNRVGAAGVVLSAASMGVKLYTGSTVTTAEYVSAAIGAGFLVAGAIVAGTAAAPFVATAALVYGVLELGSYATTGQSLEQHIFQP